MVLKRQRSGRGTRRVNASHQAACSRSHAGGDTRVCGRWRRPQLYGRRYRLADDRTPYEKLVSLAGWEQHLKPGISAAMLQQQARRMSDTACARKMQQAKRKLLAEWRSRW